MNARRRIFYGTAAIAAVCLTTTACTDPTGGDRLAERDPDDTVPVAVEVNPAELTVREGDTAVLRVTVRNSKGRTLNPGAPHYLLNWSAPGVEILHEGRVANTLTIRGSRGGTSEVQFVVVPFSTPSSSSANTSAVVAAREIRGAARVKVVGTPTIVNVVSGDNQAAQPGGTLEEGVTVQVLDKRRKPVAEHEVAFSIRSGGGSISPQRVVTDEQGHATVTWKLGSELGEQRAAAAAGEVEAELTAVAQPEAAQVVIAAGNGQSAEASARLRDSVAVQVKDANGNGVSGVSVYWATTSGGGQVAPAQGVSDTNGVVRASWTLGGTSGTQTLSAKAPGVGEVTFTATATSGVAPGVHHVMVTPDKVTLDAINDEASLSATVYDAANQTLKESVTWQSLNSGVASVDAAGNVTARAVGTALIVAVASGVSDTSAITVRQVPASIEIAPASVSLTAGNSAQLNATVRDAGGSTIASPNVSWQSSNVGVASITSSGVVSGVSSGTAVITATSGTVGTQAAVSVSGTPSTGSPSTIPLTLHRLDGRTGTVRVSNGILLRPGQLRDTQTGSIAVQVGGVEVPAFVEALHGRHPDGSVISVLVQFDADPAKQNAASLHIGTTPKQKRLSKQVVDYRSGADFANAASRGYPAAVALPPIDHMSAAFNMFGPTVSVAQAAANGVAFSAYDSDFAYWSAEKWNGWQDYLLSGSSRDRILGSTYYDRGYHHFAWLHRSGNPEYFKRGGAYVFNNRYHYYEYHSYNIGEYRWFPEGLAAHYWLTGDEESRNAVNRLAHKAWGNGASWNWTRMYDCNYKGEARPVARALMAMTWAHRLGYNDADWGSNVRGYVDLIANADAWNRDTKDYRYGAWVYKHPDFPTDAGCTVAFVSNFMNSMILDALITVYEHVHADPRIPGIVKRNLDYLRTTQWRGPGGNGLQAANGEPSPSFNYYDVSVGGSGGPNATVDLNGFYVHVFAWYGRHSGDRTYTDLAHTIFATLSMSPKDGKTAPWLRVVGSDKQFNETYQKAWQFAGYIR